MKTATRPINVCLECYEQSDCKCFMLPHMQGGPNNNFGTCEVKGCKNRGPRIHCDHVDNYLAVSED